jgi:tRNA G10  N-methylase Trm11
MANTKPATTNHLDERIPLAIWPCAQSPGYRQRAGRYVAESIRHPGKMLPELARRIVLAYSSSRDLVLDPMCGIGTTLVETAALGRRCIGVELEERWVDVTRANLRNALSAQQRRLATVRRGDARSLTKLLKTVRNQVDLIIVSPPYACDAGVIDKRAWLRGQRLCDESTENYSPDPRNLGHARGRVYRTVMAEVYTQCLAMLRSGGLLVTVTKNMRQRGRMLDLARVTIDAASSAGFGYLQHNIALHAAVRDNELVARPSFWQLDQTRRARAAGLPLHLIAHEDVLVFRKTSDRHDG